jgi:hypothetical protein
MPALRDLLRSTADQFEQLTGRRVDAVSSVQRDGDGWQVAVEAVELERIPASTSLLGSYTVRLDAEGEITEYHRSGRYYRNRPDEEVGA